MNRFKIPGIPEHICRLMDSHAHTALTTESDSVSESNLGILIGYLGYAVASGAISVSEHSAAWSNIRLIREERRLVAA